MTLTNRFVPLVVLSIAVSPPAWGQGRAKSKPEPVDPAGIARLVADSGGAARVTLSAATGAARFVRLAPGGAQGLLKSTERAVSLQAKQRQSAEFFEAYGSIFGISDAAAQLEQARVVTDRLGGTHITYAQVHHGVPVFAGALRTHFNAAHELVAVNGTFVPDITVDVNPRRTAEEAGRTALAKVASERGRAPRLAATATTLLVFREGLAKGVPGPSDLVWQVEVGDGASVREFVYVDAHTGKVVDQITGVQDSLYRRAYDGQNLPSVPPSYPSSPF